MEKIHALATTDQTKIIRWIEERGGKPAILDSKNQESSPHRLLKVKFKDTKSTDLSTISWDNFLKYLKKINWNFCFKKLLKMVNRVGSLSLSRKSDIFQVKQVLLNKLLRLQ